MGNGFESDGVWDSEWKPTETYVFRSTSISEILLDRAGAGAATSLCQSSDPRFELLYNYVEDLPSPTCKRARNG